MKFFKKVKALSCIFCHRDFDMNDATFRTMNRHEWGCCSDCWKMDLPNATSATHVFIPPTILAQMHNQTV